MSDQKDKQQTSTAKQKEITAKIQKVVVKGTSDDSMEEPDTVPKKSLINDHTDSYQNPVQQTSRPEPIVFVKQAVLALQSPRDSDK